MGSTVMASTGAPLSSIEAEAAGQREATIVLSSLRDHLERALRAALKEKVEEVLSSVVDEALAKLEADIHSHRSACDLSQHLTVEVRVKNSVKP